ncbi:hypothetical protein [Moorena producens]|uniref:hypothetical protein n=1 Tax=Moorena producens TaxID=1155739 RepID=UPI0011EA7005|nr:hypothetical protein [Moorena producens]
MVTLRDEAKLPRLCDRTYGGLHNYQVHIVSPLPTSDFPLPCSLLRSPYKPKTLYLTEVQTAVYTHI